MQLEPVVDHGRASQRVPVAVDAAVAHDDGGAFVAVAQDVAERLELIDLGGANEFADLAADRLALGAFGLKAVEPGRITARQIEVADGLVTG